MAVDGLRQRDLFVIFLTFAGSQSGQAARDKRHRWVRPGHTPPVDAYRSARLAT